jgi:hypothetical protein
MLLEDVSLVDPDGGRRVVRVRLIEVAKTDHGLIAIASQPEIGARQLQRLGEILYTRILRGPKPAEPMQLLLGDVTMQGTAGAMTFSDVRVALDTPQDAVQVTLDFLVAGQDKANPLQLQVTRSRDGAAPASTWQLRTAAGQFPCALLADYLPPLAALGPDCQFQGTAWIEQDGRGWNGEIAGRFVNADLGNLIAPFPHKLSGSAEIMLSHSRFEQGRVVEVAGSLSSGGGVISRSLLDAASDSLRLTANSVTDEQTDTLLAYRQLAIGFQIDAASIRMSGLCDGRQQDVVLLGANGKPLLQSSAKAVPSVALTRALVPQSELQVPATSATEILLRALPMPQITPPAARTARQPYSSLRLRD